MFTGKIQVQRRSLPQPRRDLPPVHLHHVARKIEHRHNQRTIEVLVPRLLVAQDAKLFQPRPLRLAGGAVRRRQMVTQCAVGVAQPEVLDHLRRLQAALHKILLRLRLLLQRLVVVAHHDFQQLLVLRPGVDQRRQLRNRALFHRLPSRFVRPGS